MILPDDTHLTTLSLWQRKLTISGRSAAAARLIGAMAAQPLIHNPAFAAPVIRDEDNGGEKFSIRRTWSCELKPSLPMGRTGQLLAMGLAALGLAALWLGIASPLIAWHGERAEALANGSNLPVGWRRWWRRFQHFSSRLPRLRRVALATRLCWRATAI